MFLHLLPSCPTELGEPGPGQAFRSPVSCTEVIYIHVVLSAQRPSVRHTGLKTQTPPLPELIIFEFAFIFG
jgi:hypothetical protein